MKLTFICLLFFRQNAVCSSAKCWSHSTGHRERLGKMPQMGRWLRRRISLENSECKYFFIHYFGSRISECIFFFIGYIRISLKRSDYYRPEAWPVNVSGQQYQLGMLSMFDRSRQHFTSLHHVNNQPGQAFGAVQSLPEVAERVLPWPGRVLPSSTLPGCFRVQTWVGSNHY